MTAGALRPVAALLDIHQKALLFHCVCAAGRLGVFEQLAPGPLAVPELAAVVGGDEQALRRVLRLLAGHGVVDLDLAADRVGLTETGEVLCRRHELSLGATFATFGLPDVAHALTETLRTGRPATGPAVGTGFWQHLGRHPDQQTVFSEAMAEQAQLLTVPCVPLLEWPAAGTVADIAGGSGTLIAQVLAEQPRLQGVLVDQPKVLERARSLLKDAGLDDRCAVHEGDLFDPPPPADMYLLSRVLHDWDDAGVVRILAALAGAARPAARLRIFEDVLPGDGLPSAAQSWADVAMLALYDGARERTAEEFRALLAAGGWRLDRVVEGPPGMCVLEAGPARDPAAEG
jgi:O-methyltransferase domain